MKKILALLTALSLLAFGMTCVAAEEKPEEFNSGDYTYVLLDDETVTITGYHGSDSMVTIPDQLEGKMVTGIGDKAFLRCKSMTSVTIPDSVTRIGLLTFDKCNNLTVTVSRDSFAKQYCEKYGVRYTCPEAND